MSKEKIATYIKTAKKYDGVTEHPKGSNRGPDVDKFLASVGWDEPAPWCAAYLNFVGRETASDQGFRWPVPMTASCDVILDWARRANVLYLKPKPGDLFLVMASENDATHIGIVTELPNEDSFTEISGNTNDDGGREGYAVLSRSRRREARYRFVRWIESLETTKWEVRLDGKTIPSRMLDGRNFVQARTFFEALRGKADTTQNLKWKGPAEGLYWDEVRISVPVFLWDGATYVQLAGAADWAGRTLTIDSEKRRVTVEDAV